MCDVCSDVLVLLENRKWKQLRHNIFNMRAFLRGQNLNNNRNVSPMSTNLYLICTYRFSCWSENWFKTVHLHSCDETNVLPNQFKKFQPSMSGTGKCGCRKIEITFCVFWMISEDFERILIVYCYSSFV